MAQSSPGRFPHSTSNRPRARQRKGERPSSGYLAISRCANPSRTDGRGSRHAREPRPFPLSGGWLDRKIRRASGPGNDCHFPLCLADHFGDESALSFYSQCRSGSFLPFRRQPSSGYQAPGAVRGESDPGQAPGLVHPGGSSFVGTRSGFSGPDVGDGRPGASILPRHRSSGGNPRGKPEDRGESQRQQGLGGNGGC